MEYGIKCNDKVIAMFVNASDRDLCLGRLREAYDDCEFEAVEVGK